MNWKGALFDPLHLVNAGAGKMDTVTIRNLIRVEPKGLLMGTTDSKYEESLQTVKDTADTTVTLNWYIMTTHGVFLDL